MKNRTFWTKLREYFSVYLPKQRNSSQKTIDTYKNAWNLLLRYMLKECNIPASDFRYELFTKEVVAGFLDSEEAKKNWKAATRNNRLNCIRAFFKYAGVNCPEAFVVYSDLGTIPEKKGINQSNVVDFMPEDAITSIINCIDKDSRKGLRDRFFITLMYDVAARDGEMLQLKLSDVNTDNSTLTIMGKGTKLRMVPISKETIEMFIKYKKAFHDRSKPDEYLFYTVHRGDKTPMSDDNVARFITAYARKARETNANVPPNVHPHMIRHSRAMHLYRGKMPLSVLSEFLGHENPETTLIYARADTEMKREAIARASSKHIFPDENVDSPVWENDDSIIERLIRGY